MSQDGLRKEEERKWWKELQGYSDNNDVAGFFHHFAKYLEWNKTYSTNRQIVHKMATMAHEMLKKADPSNLSPAK
jgi:hypothetical protein